MASRGVRTEERSVIAEVVYSLVNMSKPTTKHEHVRLRHDDGAARFAPIVAHYVGAAVASE